jgi:hypothetical protein
MPTAYITEEMIERPVVTSTGDKPARRCLGQGRAAAMNLWLYRPLLLSWAAWVTGVGRVIAETFDGELISTAPISVVLRRKSVVSTTS